MRKHLVRFFCWSCLRSLQMMSKFMPRDTHHDDMTWLASCFQRIEFVYHKYYGLKKDEASNG